jgi:hypothetical protein
VKHVDRLFALHHVEHRVPAPGTARQLEVWLADENLQQFFLRRGFLGGLFFLGLLC